MNVPLHIDFVSDVTCPWCAIGLAGLEQAIVRLDGEVPVELRFQPFELNPGIAREGEPIADYAWRKYRAGADELAHRQALIRGRGAEAGLALAERTHVYNTFDAHRLLHWAGLESAPRAGPQLGPPPAGVDELGSGASFLGGRQHALKRALLTAYHLRRENPALPVVLVAAAAAAGLDAGRAGEVIERSEYAAEVRAAVRHWQAQGIDGVPAIVVDGRWLIQGGQRADAIEQALRRIAAGQRRATAGG